MYRDIARRRTATGGQSSAPASREQSASPTRDRSPITSQRAIHNILNNNGNNNTCLTGTTRVSRYQKGKTNLDFTEASDSECRAVTSAGPYANLHLAPD